MVDWNSVREDFPVTRDKIYFMSSAMSPIPNQVFDRVVAEHKKINECGDIFWDKDIAKNKEVRAKVGDLINATADDLAFVSNTSTAMSIVALTLKGQAGSDSNIVSMMDEFPASTVPFEYQGIKMRYVEPCGGRYPVDSVMEKVNDRTIAVLTSYVQYSTGFRQNLVELGARLKERDVMLIVNSTQAFPFFPLDMKSMSVSAMSASLHKWGFIGQIGAVFYTSPEFRARFKSPMAGWLSVDPSECGLIYTKKNQQIKIRESADRYVFGSINFQAINVLEVSLDYLGGIGYDDIRARIFELTGRFVNGLKAMDVKIVSPVDNLDERSAIVSFNIGGRTRSLVSHLEKKKIYVSYRNGNARVSVNIFNDESDIDRLLSEIKGSR